MPQNIPSGTLSRRLILSDQLISTRYQPRLFVDNVAGPPIVVPQLAKLSLERSF
jgi:hypothetical protein